MSKKRNPETPPMLNDEARKRELDALDRYALETEQPGKQTTYDPTAGDPDRSWMKWHEALTRPVERQDFSGGPTLEDSWRFEYKDATGFFPAPDADRSSLDKERARIAQERKRQEEDVKDKENRGVFARIEQMAGKAMGAGMMSLYKLAAGNKLAHEEAPENWQKVENMFGMIGVDQETQEKIIEDLRARGVADPFKLPVDVWAQSITGKTYDELLGEFQKHEQLDVGQKLWKSTGKAALSEMYKVAVQQFVGTGAASLSKYMGDLANRDVLVSLADAVNPKGKVLKNAITDAQVATWNWADQHISKMQEPEQKIEVFGKTILKWDNNERSIRNVKDPWKFMEFAFSNAGQGLVQIPLNIMTRGLSGFMQELGGNYLDQVRRTGEEMGITPGEVIRQGHDDRAMATGFALMQAMLEYMGAGKVWKGFTQDQIKSGWIRSMANFFSQIHSSGKTEFWTEAAQGFLNKYQAEQHALDGNAFKAIKNIDVIDLIDEGLAGYFGAAGVHVVGSAARPLSKALNDYQDAKTREALADKLAAQFTEKGVNVTRGQIYERLNQLAGWKLPKGVEMPEHVRLMRDDYIGLQESAKKLSEQYKKDADPRTLEALVETQRVLEPFVRRQELWTGQKMPKKQFAEWVSADDNTVRNTRAAKDYFDKKGKLIVTAGGLINNEVLSGLYDADINSVQTFTEAAEKNIRRRP
jgi:hypothetical protein